MIGTTFPVAAWSCPINIDTAKNLWFALRLLSVIENDFFECQVQLGYLSNSIKAAEDNLVNMPVEEQSCPLAKDLLEKTVYTLSYLLRKL